MDKPITHSLAHYHHPKTQGLHLGLVGSVGHKWTDLIIWTGDNVRIHRVKNDEIIPLEERHVRRKVRTPGRNLRRLGHRWGITKKAARLLKGVK